MTRHRSSRGARVRVAAALCCGALAACGGSPPPPPAPPPPVPAVDLRPHTPPPRVDWVTDHFDVHGLPAVARANEVIVLDAPAAAAQELRIEVRDRDDKVLETIVATPATVDAANQRLATLHGIHDLAPMHPLAVEPGHDGEDNHWATGDNLDLEWRDHQLSVFVHNGRAALVVDDGTPWLVADHAACKSPAYLREAFHAARHDVAVIAIGYRGSDGCDAVRDQRHVIAWYPR